MMRPGDDGAKAALATVRVIGAHVTRLDTEMAALRANTHAGQRRTGGPESVQTMS